MVQGRFAPPNRVCRSPATPLDFNRSSPKENSVMGQVKLTNTRYIPHQCPKFNLKGVHPDWEMHPSWISGIEALNAYNHWVSEVVMPIAFQWIEEHHDEVYASVAKENFADVGVVIAAAYELVKQLSSYKNGMKESKKYQAALEAGKFDTAKINPVWTGIVKKVRAATEESYEAQAGVLKDTIRL
jgi:hypothetical protein